MAIAARYCHQSKFLTEIRKKSGMTQLELARVVGMHKMTYHRLEIGVYKLSLNQISKLHPLFKRICELEGEQSIRDFYKELTKILLKDYQNIINRHLLAEVINT